MSFFFNSNIMLRLQEAADEIVAVFSQSEPSQLVTVCASPAMAQVSPAQVLRRLQHLEHATGMSVPLTVTMATMALRLDDLQHYTELMGKHAEVRVRGGSTSRGTRCTSEQIPRSRVHF